MKAISNALKGVTYHNPQLGESLYELCRRATSRHISGPDEIMNQQVVYMINSEMHTPYAAKDACTCLKRRLQMDHPQKQYLAIILTSKVLQECHAAIGIHQGELLQEVAYILRTCRSSGPASARTRQVAMDVLRHFGSGGVDAYRQARQQAGQPVGTRVNSVNRDPAAIAAERASLLDEIKRMCEQAGASTEILNELLLNKEQAAAAGGSPAADGVDSIGLRKELLADVAELRKLFDLYMEQLASLTGPDAEQAMKEALEAVDMLDNALTLEKDVDAELTDLKAKGELPAPEQAPRAAAAESSSTAAADTAAAKMQSMNLIDLEDEAPPATATRPATDPFATPSAVPGAVDPFAPAVQSPPAAALDPFAPVPAATPADPWAPAAAAAAADPFAALAAAPTGGAAAEQPYSAAAADPFAEPSPWGAPASSTPTATAGGSPVGLPMQPQAPPSAGGASAVSAGGASASSVPLGGSAGVSGGGAPASAALAAAVPPSLAAAGMSAGGYMPQPAAGLSPYGAPGTPGYGGMQVQQGVPAAYGYGMQQVPSPYGMPQYGMPGAAPMYAPQMTGNQYNQPTAGPYAGMGSPYPSPYVQQPQQMQMPAMLQQQQPQQSTGGFAAPSASVPSVQSPPASEAAGALSPTNPFASVAPAPASGGVPNPFGAVSAGGAAAHLDQEWNTFFNDNRTGVQAGK